MKRRNRLWLPVLAAATLATIVLASPAVAKNPNQYRVTITNLTGGQPFTPPVVATHRRATSVFEIGAPASFGVKEIAENGNNAPLLDALAGDPFVSDSLQGSAGPLVPPGTPLFGMFGNSATFTITADPAANYFSWVSMLVCTNDGFTGVHGLRLPKQVGESVTVTTRGYDAGTERNTEDFADIVPPCQGLIGISSGEAGTGMSNPALAEGGVISLHSGIAGGSDLLRGVHGWANPVARVTIEAIG